MPIFRLLKDSILLPKIVVVIDVFRSSNTIIEMLTCGAKMVIPTAEVSDAIALKKKNHRWLAFGERQGIKIDGFDGDNSPTQVDRQVLDRTIVLTTSGGTRAINACKNEKIVYFGSFANAKALIRRLRVSHKGDDIGFWAVGVEGNKIALEDELCAQYLNALWKDEVVNFDNYRDDLLSCPGAVRLHNLKQNKDLDYCTTVDSRDVVPILNWRKGLPCIEK
jgi:phosphosulfolactate phosphohydrolase-like enzyme